MEMGGKEERILVVDDDPQLRALLVEMLATRGAHVAQVGGAVEALDHVRNMTVDLVITDIVMPGMDGHSLITALKQEVPWVKVVAVTGGYRGLWAARLGDLAQQCGADRVLLKPFLQEDLMRAVVELLSPVVEDSPPDAPGG
ncbi:MAG: response regulator [Magnetococcales bacterium]|nr:response regulator [Magnetococcales bacterium]